MTIHGEIQMTFDVMRRLHYSSFTAQGIAIVVGMEVLLVTLGLTVEQPAMKVIYLVGAVILVPLSEWKLRRSWRRLRSSPIMEAPWRYEITSTTVSVQTPVTQVTVLWRAITRVRTARHGWFLITTGPKSRLILPREVFSAEDQRTIDAQVIENTKQVRSLRGL